MRVDHEQAWALLRQELVQPDEHGRPRQGIGIDKLLALMGRIEAECVFEEGHLEATLRRYGFRVADDIRLSGAEPAPPERHGATGDGDEPALSGRGHKAAPKEDAPCPQTPPSATAPPRPARRRAGRVARPTTASLSPA